MGGWTEYLSQHLRCGPTLQTPAALMRRMDCHQLRYFIFFYRDPPLGQANPFRSRPLNG